MPVGFTVTLGITLSAVEPPVLRTVTMALKFWPRDSRAGTCTDSIISAGGVTTTIRFEEVGGEVTCTPVALLVPFTERVKLIEPAAAPFSVYCQARLAVAPAASEAIDG